VKAITYAEKSWFVGDGAADAVIEYAVLLARTNSADSVALAAISTEGDERQLTLVIGPATMLTSEPVETLRTEPDNDDAIARIRERIRIIKSPPITLPASERHDVSWEDLS